MALIDQNALLGNKKGFVKAKLKINLQVVLDLFVISV